MSKSKYRSMMKVAASLYELKKFNQKDDVTAIEDWLAIIRARNILENLLESNGFEFTGKRSRIKRKVTE